MSFRVDKSPALRPDELEKLGGLKYVSGVPQGHLTQGEDITEEVALALKPYIQEMLEEAANAIILEALQAGY